MTNQAMMYLRAELIPQQLRLTYLFIVQLIIDGNGYADESDVLKSEHAHALRGAFEVTDGRWSVGWYVKEKKSGFQKPMYSEVHAYFEEQKMPGESSKFYDFYESKGWMIGKNKMKDWRAAVRNWVKTSQDKLKSNETNGKLTSKIGRDEASEYLAQFSKGN
jgi:hypothetical protein